MRRVNGVERPHESRRRGRHIRRHRRAKRCEHRRHNARTLLGQQRGRRLRGRVRQRGRVARAAVSKRNFRRRARVAFCAYKLARRRGVDGARQQPRRNEARHAGKRSGGTDLPTPQRRSQTDGRPPRRCAVVGDGVHAVSGIEDFSKDLKRELSSREENSEQRSRDRAPRSKATRSRPAGAARSAAAWGGSSGGGGGGWPSAAAAARASGLGKTPRVSR